ncbi:carboxymuconolactone decarboxylase family protein [Rhodovulum sp.]|uniref:carboxymuconolactone decarboxylase family protein n=1 Tax=Rhodovulum sp. TaxID=34009 RepID=UPI0017E9A9BD|nr:carboxymuconolactone decarboxylase family protein [Rhodovulum sp.]HDR27816.1 carboxymuconolactone decarboxylase family protein [Rhodovulum sp.]
MSGYAKLFEQMLEQSHKMARAFNPALESFQVHGFDKLIPTMPKDFIEMMWGNTFNREGLDAKTRLLVVLAGLTVLGAQADTQFKLTLRHALAAGATEREIAEVIYQMAMLGGIPAMTRALELAQSVFDEQHRNEEDGG